MKLTELISNLQKKPYQTRLRILWTTVAVVGLFLMVIWIATIRSEVAGLNLKNDILSLTEKKQAEENSNFIKIERIESADTGAFKIFFSVNNPTDDILNFAAVENIKLTVNNTPISPLRILDRQKKSFVLKILSHTQNFGILYFNPPNDEAGQLTFSDLFFEKKPEQLFKENFDLVFQELNKPEELRK